MLDSYVMVNCMFWYHFHQFVIGMKMSYKMAQFPDEIKFIIAQITWLRMVKEIIS